MKRYDERIKAPSFEEIDRKDPVAFKAARDRWNLERLVELEILKIYRDRVTECHRREEVNARQNCRKVVGDYMKAFNEYKRKGTFTKHMESQSKILFFCSGIMNFCFDGMH